MLSTPAIDEHPTDLADWWELNALASSDGSYPLANLYGDLELTRDAEAEEIDEIDSQHQQVTDIITAEISTRHDNLDDAYPFSLVNSGRVLSLDSDRDLPADIYLFCLFLSHAKTTCVSLDGLYPEIKNSERNLFEACATVGAAAIIHGTTIQFGWPRPDESKFLEKLEQVHSYFREGKLREKPLPHIDVTDIKDAGIDVIGWRHHPDNKPGKLYLLGQAATGQSWERKSLKQDIDRFHYIWYEIEPSSTPIPATFIPFCLKVKTGNRLDFSEETLNSLIEDLTKSHGAIFYRYRLPRLCGEGIRLAEVEENISIEGIGELSKVSEWVNNFIGIISETV